MSFAGFITRARLRLGPGKKVSAPPAEGFLSEVAGVVHVGANTGQERDLYHGLGLPTLWIEAIPEIFARLCEHIQGFGDQRALQALVTDTDGRSHAFHLSNNNGASSSILGLKHHRELWPEVDYVGALTLESITLPTLLKREGIELPRHQALVLDTQGSELLVLRGALPVLDAFDYIMTEVPDFESYEGCCQRTDIHAFMTEHGYEEFSCRAFAGKTGVGSYFDIVYRKRSLGSDPRTAPARCRRRPDSKRRHPSGKTGKPRSALSLALRRIRRRLLPPSAAEHARRMDAVLQRLDRLEQSFQQSLYARVVSVDQESVLQVLRLIAPRRPLGHRKVRMGGLNDGGYVQLDDVSGLVCALSLGVGDNDSWDLAMAGLGVPVHQFDHTVDRAPSCHPLLTFHRLQIQVLPGPGGATLPELIQRHSQGEDADLLLKMDIEGAEWDVLDACPPDLLQSFTQIVCEFHDLRQLGEPRFLARTRRVFGKLYDRFAVVHVHANNSGGIHDIAGIPVAGILELTFARKERYATSDEPGLFPTPLDMPNLPGQPEIRLGAFRF